MGKHKAITTHDILSVEVKDDGTLGKPQWVGCARTWEDGDIELTFIKPLVVGARHFLRANKQ